MVCLLEAVFDLLLVELRAAEEPARASFAAGTNELFPDATSAVFASSCGSTGKEEDMMQYYSNTLSHCRREGVVVFALAPCILTMTLKNVTARRNVAPVACSSS